MKNLMNNYRYSYRYSYSGRYYSRSSYDAKNSIQLSG